MSISEKMDSHFMQAALEEAQKAAEQDEVPVGAVVVAGDAIIARAGNRTITDKDPTAHAEILALRLAAAAVGNHRLLNTWLYVTIEPCVMCAGAMIQARIERLVYGADDFKGGAIRSCFQIAEHAQLNHQIAVTHGVMAAEGALLLLKFFAERRRAANTVSATETLPIIDIPKRI